MNSNKIKKIAILIILTLSFLIAGPLRTQVFLMLSFSPVLAYLVISSNFYIALLACLIIDLIPQITLKAILKSLCLVFAFFVLQEVVAFFGIIASIVFEIIRPLVLMGVIILSNIWSLGANLVFEKKSIVLLSVSFGLGVLCIVVPLIATFAPINTLSINNDFFGYLGILTGSNIYFTYGLRYLAQMLLHFFIAVLFMQNKLLKQDAQD